MASKKKLNERCPLQGDCERKCLNIGSETNCDFFNANLTLEIEDAARRAGIVLPTFEESIDWDSVPDLVDDPDNQDLDCTEDLDNESDIKERHVVDDYYPVVSFSEAGVQFLGGESGYTAKIQDCIDRVKSEFLHIGLLLHEVDAFGYYREAGFSNVYEYCEVSFGFKRSSTNNFIRIYRKFGEAMGLQDRYKGYSYSQLTEMCSMNDNQLRQCDRTMSVQKLRELKRSYKTSIIEVDPVQTSGKNQSVSVELHDVNHSYLLPDWLVIKMQRYFEGFSREKIFEALDAGLVSIYGCKLGNEI